MVLDIIVVLIYLAAMVAVGWIGMRRARTTEDYLVAGRRLGPGFYMGTLSAVVLGGASTIGTAALGYRFGISGMWLVVMLGLGIIVLSAFLAGPLTRTLLLEDLYERFFKREAGEHIAANRRATLLVGVAVLIIACLVNDVIGALTVAYNLLVGGLLVPIIGAFVWRRATGAGALAAIATGGAVVVIFMLKDGLLADSPIYFGLLASLVAYVVVSLRTTPTPEQQLVAWEQRLEGNGATDQPVPAPAFH